jgi:hypothetical protein
MPAAEDLRTHYLSGAAGGLAQLSADVAKQAHKHTPLVITLSSTALSVAPKLPQASQRSPGNTASRACRHASWPAPDSTGRSVIPMAGRYNRRNRCPTVDI